MPSSQGKHWCFTLNNYSEGEYQLLADLCDSDHVSYGVLGREEGENGTPHIQGYVAFADRKRFAAAKQLLGNRVHLELAKGTPKQASDYCKKDGDFNEFGECPGGKGSKKGQWERVKEWCDERDTMPSNYELFEAFPELYGRYKHALRDVCRLRIKVPSVSLGDLRPWQRDLERLLDEQPDDRRITFVVDPDGNNGKSWFTRYWLKKNPGKGQILSVAKRDDLAHMTDESRTTFFIDVPRGSMEYLQYGFLEQLKNGYVISPKYDSTVKELVNNVHVVVMCNEEPSSNALTRDRYHYVRLDAPPY